MTWTTTPASEIRPGDRVRIKETGVEGVAGLEAYHLIVRSDTRTWYPKPSVLAALGLTLEVWTEPRHLPTEVGAVIRGNGIVAELRSNWVFVDIRGYACEFDEPATLKEVGPDWVELVPKGAAS